MKVKIGSELKYPSGGAVPTVFLSGLRATVAATDVASAEVAIPANTKVIAVRASVGAWIRWGVTGLGAAAANDSSQLFPPGEAVIPVPLISGSAATHFRVLREGDTSGYVQVEQVAHVDNT